MQPHINIWCCAARAIDEEEWNPWKTKTDERVAA